MKSENIGERSATRTLRTLYRRLASRLQLAQRSSRSLSLTEILAHLSASAKGHRVAYRAVYSGTTPRSSGLIIDRCITLTERLIVARAMRNESPSRNDRPRLSAITNSLPSEFSLRFYSEADIVNKGYLRRKNTSNK